MRTQRTESPFDQWAADNAEVVGFLTAAAFDPEGSRFLADLARVVRGRRPLTPSQVNAVARNIARRADRDRRTSAPAVPGSGQAPTGRVTVEGTVTEVAARPGFETDKPDYKMTVDCGGYQVWCTVPKVLYLNEQATDLGLTGARVRFAVTLTPSPDNAAITVGKAPRRAELLAFAPVIASRSDDREPACVG